MYIGGARLEFVMERRKLVGSLGGFNSGLLLIEDEKRSYDGWLI